MNYDPQSGAVAAHSRFVQRVRRRYAADLPLLTELLPLAEGMPDWHTITELVQQLQAAGRELPSALRVARQLVIERVAVLDIEHGASLDAVTGCMTHLAEATLEIALAAATAESDARHGQPLNAEGQRIDFWIVGMGKLGARELNVSSDVDLIYIFEEDGQTTGRKPVSAQEYFSFVAKRLYTLIGETTEDGFVFRVDLALRPNGNSGPPVTSLAMLETYFQVQGREWERFAWLKSRVVAPRSAVDSGRALALRDLVTPFVYRRYLDYGVFEALRQLHRKVRDEAQRRAAGRPERANDVKLSRGGIREIEFIVQLLLVVRGGQFPEVRTRRTLRALDRLESGGLMTPQAASALADGYTFLRQVEHRIQYLDDQQTHLLPTDDADLRWTAQSLGFGGVAGGTVGRETSALLDKLGEVREAVVAEFDALLSEGRTDGQVAKGDGEEGSTGPDGNGSDCKSCTPGPLAIDDDDLLNSLPAELAARVRPWAQSARVSALRDEGRMRLGRLLQKTAAALADEQCTLTGAMRFIDWLDPLLRRPNYLSLLLERPDVHQRLLRLLCLARWPLQYMLRHPGVIDELADDRLLHQRFNRADFIQELEDRHAAWERSGEAHQEQLLDTLRRAHHAEVFRTLVRDVDGDLTVENVSDDLSALADAVLDVAMRWCWLLHKQRHREEPQVGIVAYGKLGGAELGYGGDVDLVFLFDDTAAAGPEAQQQLQSSYTAYVRKLITWLTLRTEAGELFDVDTALRPNGNAGLLVSTIASFEDYQRGRGSNTAWTWEHQALTRARYAAGAPGLAARFEATRRAVLSAQRDPQALLEEVRAMRAKVHAAHPVPAERFDVKHSHGGMMDVEFAVQYLVLAHGEQQPELLDNVGNIGLLLRAEKVGLLPAGLGQSAADAYRALRRAQHQARLDEQPTQFDDQTLAGPRQAVLALWQAVFS